MFRYMFDNFFKHIDIDPKNAHVLDGNAPDLVAECAEYERKIAAAGGIELFVGGWLKWDCLIVFSILILYTTLFQVLDLTVTLPSMNLAALWSLEPG